MRKRSEEYVGNRILEMELLVLLDHRLHLESRFKNKLDSRLEHLQRPMQLILETKRPRPKPFPQRLKVSALL